MAIGKIDPPARLGDHSELGQSERFIHGADSPGNLQEDAEHEVWRSGDTKMSTEAALIELTGIVSTLRRDFDKHEESDKKNFKYAHNMLEDLIGKVANRERERLGDEMKLREMLAGMRVLNSWSA